jgi:hypothetical protein
MFYGHTIKEMSCIRLAALKINEFKFSLSLEGREHLGDPNIDETNR